MTGANPLSDPFGSCDVGDLAGGAWTIFLHGQNWTFEHQRKQDASGKLDRRRSQGLYFCAAKMIAFLCLLYLVFAKGVKNIQVCAPVISIYKALQNLVHAAQLDSTLLNSARLWILPDSAQHCAALC